MCPLTSYGSDRRAAIDSLARGVSLTMFNLFPTALPQFPSLPFTISSTIYCSSFTQKGIHEDLSHDVAVVELSREQMLGLVLFLPSYRLAHSMMPPTLPPFAVNLFCLMFHGLWGKHQQTKIRNCGTHRDKVESETRLKGGNISQDQGTIVPCTYVGQDHARSTSCGPIGCFHISGPKSRCKTNPPSWIGFQVATCNI